ncbi:MAG: geranylgeranyl reductase family protein [bacterium]
MIQQEHYDVCVIGAGPAGSTAACELAARGLRTVLIDRASFPRDKVCGDGISPRAVRILKEMGLHDEEVFSRFCRIEGVRISSPGRRLMEVRLTGDPEVEEGYVIPRKVFDHFLLQAALRRGAEIREGCEVLEIESAKRDACIRARTRQGRTFSLHAGYVVAAWGAHAGRLLRSRRTAPAADRLSVVAVRAYFEGVEPGPPFMEIHFDPGLVPGYGWFFPTGRGSANVGYGMRLDCLRARRDREPLRSLFRQLVETNPFLTRSLRNAAQVGPLRGARIPFRGVFRPLARGRVLMVGDAAGLADPLSGEGIATAMRSGSLAARSIVSAVGSGDPRSEASRTYRSDCRSEITRDLLCARILQSILVRPALVGPERLLDLFVEKAQQNARLARAIARLVIGDLPRTAVLRGAAWKKLFRALRGRS